jgi:hypothetical protein
MLRRYRATHNTEKAAQTQAFFDALALASVDNSRAVTLSQRLSSSTACNLNLEVMQRENHLPAHISSGACLACEGADGALIPHKANKER